MRGVARSGEKSVAPALAGVQAGRAGEYGAAGVLDVLVEGVGGERLLQPDELGRVLHEGDEEQAAEQGAGLRVDAVGERIAAAQDPGPAVVLETGEPDVGVRGNSRLAVAPARGEVRCGELAASGQRGAGNLRPADDVLLILQVVAVPVLDEDADLAGYQVAAAAQPRLVGLAADPDPVVHQGFLLGLDVAGAVFEAEQVARGGLAGRGGGGTAEAELHPVVLDDPHADPGQVADGVEGHEGVVCAGLDAQVAAGVAGVEVLVGQRRQLAESRGLAVGEAEPVIEQRRSIAEGDGQLGDRRADGLARVDWRRVGPGVLPDELPRGHGGGRGRPRPEQVAQVGAGSAGDDVERAERQPVLGRSGDAGLVRPVERHRHAAVADHTAGRIPWVRARPGEEAGHDACPGGTSPGKHPPPRRSGWRSAGWRCAGWRRAGWRRAASRLNCLVPGHVLTWTESPESDSARALTAAESWRRCGCRTVEYSTYPVSS